MKRPFVSFLASALAGLLWGQGALAYDTNAMRNLQMAVGQCERGLKVEMPQSAVALGVLKRYLGKYQRYRDAAFTQDPTLAQAGERYSGSHFENLPYSEVYQRCDSELADKVAQAEAYLARKSAEEQARLQSRAGLLETKVAQAKLQVAIAVNRHCAEFMRPPGLDALAAEQENKLQEAQDAYQAAKQGALAIYPGIGQEEHRALLREPASGESRNVTQTVQAWFDYCDQVFPSYRDNLEKLRSQGASAAPAEDEDEDSAPADEEAEEDAVGDEAEDSADTQEDIAGEEAEDSADAEEDMAGGEAEDSADTQEDMASDEAEDSADTQEDAADEEAAPAEGEDEMDAEMEAEYQDFMRLVKGDRLKVLQDEGRIPDYTPDNEDQREKANTWEFESESDDGKLSCVIYQFKANKLASTKKLKKECP